MRFDDYPYAPFREAFGTVLGRVGLVILAALGGSMLGGWTATRSMGGLWLGVVGFPDYSLASIIYGVGLFVLPALVIYAMVSVRCEWPLRLTLLCSLLMWWNIHKTIRWTEYDSPVAKQRQKLRADLQKGMNVVPENANPKNRR